jgi:hypothetical protein
MEQQQQYDQQPPSTPKFSLHVDERAKETMKWSAMWNGVAVAIMEAAAYIGATVFGGEISDALRLARAFGVDANSFDVNLFLKNIFWGLVWGAVGGFVLSIYYDLFKQWNLRYFYGRLNTLFKLIFYPTLAVELLVTILALMYAFAVGILMPLIMLSGVILARYIYAIMMVKTVGKFYK